MKVYRLFFPTLAGLALAIALLFAAVRQSQAALDTNAKPVPSASLPGTRARQARNAQITIRHVATSGIDSGDCADSASPCRTVQYAIDRASEGDEVHVAAGEYTDVNNYGDLAQIVYLTKTVAI